MAISRFSVSSIANGFPKYKTALAGYVEYTGIGRGVWAGGYGGGNNLSTIDYVSIATTGNATSFGSLTTGKQETRALSTPNYGFIWGGIAGSTAYNTIERITIATTGNASSWTTLTNTYLTGGTVGNKTRGLLGGSYVNLSSQVSTIYYITYSSAGTETTFGNLSAGFASSNGQVNDKTRGIFWTGSFSTSYLEYVTIASTGNSTNFGSLYINIANAGSACSSTRALTMSGESSAGSDYGGMQTVVIQTTGNATYWGGTTSKRIVSATSNATRAVSGGGFSSSAGNTDVSSMEYVSLASSGNATSFGSLTAARRGPSAMCDSLGGLY